MPVPTAFAPAFGAAAAGAATAATTPGVFSSVEFVPFGVQLQIRPLVGDDDTITLDVQPLVVTPDAVLTDAIRQSTGTAVATTAFQTRALRTSSRLQDGQALLIGGLLSNNTSTNTASTPGVRDTPVLGLAIPELQSERPGHRVDRHGESRLFSEHPFPTRPYGLFPDRDELLRPVIAGPATVQPERVNADRNREGVMSKVVQRLRRNNKGAALVEYALIVAGVSLIGAAAVSLFGHKVTDMLGMAAAVIPGAHADDNAPIVSGQTIETSTNTPGFDSGNSATGIGLDVNAITQSNGAEPSGRQCRRRRGPLVARPRNAKQVRPHGASRGPR